MLKAARRTTLFPDSKPFRHMQAKYLAGSLLILGALGFLVVSSLQTGTLKSVRVSQLRAVDTKPQSYVGQRLRMIGFVGARAVKKTPTQSAEGVINIAHFDVVEGKDQVKVSYSDALPDTFRPGGPVQVDGVYVAPGVMKAEHVLTKCPSKYQAGEKGMKETEQKMDGSGAVSQPVSQSEASKSSPPVVRAS